MGHPHTGTRLAVLARRISRDKPVEIHGQQKESPVEIEIKLWGNIGYYLPEDRGRFSLKKSLDKETTVQEVVEGLKLPKDLYFIITVNGRAIETEHVLRDGDEVALFRPFSGG
jgi:sulfur carrier protein ThiS